MRSSWHCILFVVLCCTPLAAQQKDTPTASADSARVVWMRHFVSNGASSIDIAIDVGVDPAGNTYVTGKCENPGTGIDYLTVKYSPLGQELWRARYDGDAHGDDIPVALKIDAQGNVLVTGKSASLAQFPVGEDGVSRYDYATVKYHSSGEQMWVARYNGPGNRTDIPAAMALDADGNVYVTGQSDVDSSLGGSWKAEVATVCYSADGNEEWVSRYPLSNGSLDEAGSIAVDDSGNVYVGATRHSYDSQWVPYARLMTIRYNPQGTRQWVAWIPADSSFLAEAVAIAVGRGDGVYMAGFADHTGSTQTSPALVAKYDFAGQLLWLRNFPDSPAVAHRASALKVDSQGNIVVGGVGGVYHCATDQGDFLFVAKYSPSGNKVWSTRYLTPYPEIRIAAMDVSTGGDIYVTASLRMGCSIPLDGVDIVSLKYSSSGSLQWIQQYEGGEHPNNIASALAVDNSGGVVVVGASGTDNQMDFVTLKYQSAGVPAWVSQASGAGRSFESVVGTILDATGNLYILGSSVSRGSNTDYMTVKFDPDGNQLWAARYDSPSNPRYNDPSAITIDAGGNVFVTGFTNDAYSTVKYSAQGEQLWARSYQGNYTSMRPPVHLGLDRWGNAYVGGWGGMVKYNSTGVEQWRNWQWPVLVMAVDSEGNTFIPGIKRNSFGVDSLFYGGDAKDIAVDDSGNVYFTLPDEPGHMTYKISPSGDESWEAQLGGDRLFLDRAGDVFVGRQDSCHPLYKLNRQGILQYRLDLDGRFETRTGVTVDETGNVYAYGLTGSERSMKIIKFGIDGTVAWQTELCDPNGIVQTPYAVNVDRSGNVYVIGNTEQADMTTKITVSKLEQITVGVKPKQDLQPATFALGQNYPNPFNPATRIPYDLPERSTISLKVFNILGQEVRTLASGSLAARHYQSTWDGCNNSGSMVSSGVYFYRIEASSVSGKVFSNLKKMLILR